MIVGQFVDTYPPCVDGVGRVTLSYCETLTAMGHEAYYIAPEAPDDNGNYDFPTLLQRSIRIPGEPFRFGVPAADFGYRRRLERIPFDIVHAQSPFTAGEEALRIAKKRNIPLVTTFHSKYYQDFLGKTHSKALAKGVVQYIVRFYEKCDGVWTVNHATADVLREYGYHGTIQVMENGTNAVTLPPEAAEKLSARFQADNRPMLLFVGQHNYKKNIHGILRACAILKKQGQPFQLVTAGDGPDFHAIVKEAEELGIAEECHFLGFMSDRDELMALYQRADLLVFPSIYDNAPMVLREAAVMGTPGLVVAGSCSAEGITDEDNGFICRDESPEAIAEAIHRALPRTNAVGLRAKETIPIGWHTIMQDVLREYEALIARKREGTA